MQVILKGQEKKKFYTHMHTEYMREWEHECTNDKANRSKCYQQVNLIQEYMGTLCTILIFGNLSVSLKLFPNKRFF